MKLKTILIVLNLLDTIIAPTLGMLLFAYLILERKENFAEKREKRSKDVQNRILEKFFSYFMGLPLGVFSIYKAIS
jgi:hypothetical protein